MFGPGNDAIDGTGQGGQGLDMRARLDRLEDYWRELRGSAQLPARADIDPVRIDTILPHCFIAERVAPTVLRLRVAGSRLGDVLGMDVRGMPLSALFDPAGRTTLAAHVDRVFDGPRIFEMSVTIPRSFGRAALPGRLLMLPLLDGSGRVSRVIGAIVWDGETGRVGRRFSVPKDMVMRSEPVDMAPAAREDTPEMPLRAPVIRKVAGARLELVVDNT